MRRIYIKGVLEKSNRGIRKNRGGVLEKTEGLYNSTYNNKNNTVRGKPTHGLFGKEIKEYFENKCVIILEKALRQKRRLYRRVNKKQWTLQFIDLHFKLGIKKEEVKRTLNWYVSHIGEEFVPIAYSAKTFCDKYPQIRDAMKRLEPEGPKIKVTRRINKRK